MIVKLLKGLDNKCCEQTVYHVLRIVVLQEDSKALYLFTKHFLENYQSILHVSLTIGHTFQYYALQKWNNLQKGAILEGQEPFDWLAAVRMYVFSFTLCYVVYCMYNVLHQHVWYLHLVHDLEKKSLLSRPPPCLHKGFLH